MFIFESPNPRKSSFGEVLEAFLGSPEVSWAVLARLGRSLGVLWVRLGAPEGGRGRLGGVLGPSWNVLEGFGDGFGEPFGSILEASLQF